MENLTSLDTTSPGIVPECGPAKPIIFSGPMIRAILDGRKTMTRRILKPQPKQNAAGMWVFPPEWTARAFTRWGGAVQADETGLRRFFESAKSRTGRPYAPGDHLWVREKLSLWPGHAEYDVDGERVQPPDAAAWDWLDNYTRATVPSIHMPRWASRITLEVTDVRVERLQDISCADAIAEGIAPAANSMTIDCETPNTRDGFARLWDTIHGPGSWDANPWVVAVSFSRSLPGRTG